MSIDFGDPLVGGTILRRPAIQSPNYVPGVSGWAINADGTAQFNELTLIVQSSTAGILIYAGQAGPGTLIGSWASAEGQDQYGNTYPAGIYAAAGVLNGLQINQATIAAAIITQATINGAEITQAAISGGTMTEAVITFDTTGGKLMVYTQTTQTVTWATNGNYQWIAPANVYTVRGQVWGANAGGSGGPAGSRGGFGGGGGEYAEEPNYPVVPGQAYSVVVGNGGTGAWTGDAGQDGTASSFDGGGIFAHPGLSHSGSPGGTGSTATIHNDGGQGGATSGGSGGGGGGGLAGATGPGGPGGNVTSGSSGGAAGAAGSGGGAAGGVGGNAGQNGGTAGGGGGGAGMGSTTSTTTKTYRPTNTYAYYGSEVGSGQRNHNGAVYQGNPNAGNNYPGDQFSFIVFDWNTIRSDLAGRTIDQITLTTTNQHSWYNSGCYIVLGYAGYTSFGGSSPGGGNPNRQQMWIGQGKTATYDVTNTLKTVLPTSSFTSLMYGPSKSTSGGGGDLWNYGYFQGGTSGPYLTVTSHTTIAGSFKGGDGPDGKVALTFTQTQALACAISPAAGTDAAGNAYAAGYTGPVTAFQPGASPTIAEAWHDFPAGINGWGLGTGGWKKYRMVAFGSVEVSLSLRLIGTKADGTVIFGAGALPAGYQVSAGKLYSVVVNTNALSANWSPAIQFRSDGSVAVYGINATGLAQLDFHGVISLILWGQDAKEAGSKAEAAGQEDGPGEEANGRLRVRDHAADGLATSEEIDQPRWA